MKVITDERCTGYSRFWHPERPARISKTLEKLRAQKELPITWAAPIEVDDEQILRSHSKEHLARVKKAEQDFDGDTPAYPEIFAYAQRSIGAAMQALKAARNGETV